MRWVQAVGLREYAARLSDTGIHGAVIALDNTFDADKFALYLQIPNQNIQVTTIFFRLNIFQFEMCIAMFYHKSNLQWIASTFNFMRAFAG